MIHITDHAVTRFISRVAPDLSFEEARVILESAAESARPLKQKTAAGHNLWEISGYNAYLVMKRDRQRQWVVVTVYDTPPLIDFDGAEFHSDHVITDHPKVPPLSPDSEAIRALKAQRAKVQMAPKCTLCGYQSNAERLAQYELQLKELERQILLLRMRREAERTERSVSKHLQPLGAAVSYLLHRARIIQDPDAQRVVDLIEDAASPWLEATAKRYVG